MTWEEIVKWSSTQMRQCGATSCDYHKHHGHNNCSLPIIQIDRQGKCARFKPKRLPKESGSAIREGRE